MPVMYVKKILLPEDQNNTSLIPRLSPAVTITHFSILQATGGWAGRGIVTRAIHKTKNSYAIALSIHNDVNSYVCCNSLINKWCNTSLISPPTDLAEYVLNKCITQDEPGTDKPKVCYNFKYLKAKNFEDLKDKDRKVSHVLNWMVSETYSDGVRMMCVSINVHIYMASFGGIFEISGWSVRWESSHILVFLFVSFLSVLLKYIATCNSIRMPPNAWECFYYGSAISLKIITSSDI